MNTIYLTNTLTRKKEEFKPIEANKVGIYTCGPTVYNYAHIGNLRAYVFADTLKRMFLANGYEVNHVINITDVGHLASDEDEGEDKLEKGAAREGKSVSEIAKFFTDAFMSDIEALNILEATEFPCATDHIAEMIAIIKTLEEKGFTYIADGNVYFDTSKFDDYGKLTGGKLDPEAQQSRVEQDKNKKNPFDFVLWFTNYKYGSHAQMWESPWGKGFPGWHIECTAMASKYLGERFDIHTGGVDHISVHHTNEIAQSEAAFGHQWVNYWLHNEFLIEKDGEKMAKSKGEFLRLQTLIDRGYEPEDYRYLLLTSHYRSPIVFSWEALDGAKQSRRKLAGKIQALSSSDSNSEIDQTYLDKFMEAINDDLNTAVALSTVYQTLDDNNLSDSAKINLVKKYDEVLGLNLLEQKQESISKEIKDLAEERLKARANKDWQKSDELRDQISTKGFEILDHGDTYTIRKK